VSIPGTWAGTRYVQPPALLQATYLVCIHTAGMLAGDGAEWGSEYLWQYPRVLIERENGLDPRPVSHRRSRHALPMVEQWELHLQHRQAVLYKRLHVSGEQRSIYQGMQLHM
jgi:hypothetical protein